MKKLCAIGEALIDFIPEAKGQRLKDVVSFKRVAGGAPANVAGAVAKLGIGAKFITQLGKDPFGDYIIEVFQKNGIDTTFVKQTKGYDTSLAFVSLASDGNRDFKFYRNTCADLQYSKEDIDEHVLDDCGILHFCSVSLVESPMKYAHKKIIEMAISKNKIICFDPNLRFSLWKDEKKLKETVLEFMPYADILKISDEELSFITGYEDIKEALPSLLRDRCKYVVYTKGKDGVELYSKNGKVEASGYQVEVKDTTGAGDSFIGAFLYKILENEEMNLLKIDNDKLHEFLDFSNLYAAYTTIKEGALDAMATKKEIEEFKNQFN